MYTTSTLSKNSSIKDTESIKAITQKETVIHTDLVTSTTNSDGLGEKALVIEMFQNSSEKDQARPDFTYTIKTGDEKRLNRNGILRVYDLNKPVNIPVTKLLGKWEKTHIGVTLVVADGKWCIAGGAAKKSIHKQVPVVHLAFQRLIKFVMA